MPSGRKRKPIVRGKPGWLYFRRLDLAGQAQPPPQPVIAERVRNHRQPKAPRVRTTTTAANQDWVSGDML
jgi:hypothetical protein